MTNTRKITGRLLGLLLLCAPSQVDAQNAGYGWIQPAHASPEADGCGSATPLLGVAVGAVIGAVAGYHLERYVSSSGGENPGLTGIMVGAVVGGAGGGALGLLTCNDENNVESLRHSSLREVFTRASSGPSSRPLRAGWPGLPLVRPAAPHLLPPEGPFVTPHLRRLFSDTIRR